MLWKFSWSQTRCANVAFTVYSVLNDLSTELDIDTNAGNVNNELARVQHINF